MLPIGSTTIGAVWPLEFARFAHSLASPICVLQARPDWPLIFIPHEPQIAARHEQRTESEPSSLSLCWSSPSSTDSVGSRSTSKVSQ